MFYSSNSDNFLSILCVSDCIKKKFSKMMIEEIRENMKKELDQQKAKVQQAAQQRAMIAQQGEMLEKQQAENKLVLMELGKYSRAPL